MLINAIKKSRKKCIVLKIVKKEKKMQYNTAIFKKKTIKSYKVSVQISINIKKAYSRHVPKNFLIKLVSI